MNAGSDNALPYLSPVSRYWPIADPVQVTPDNRCHICKWPKTDIALVVADVCS